MKYWILKILGDTRNEQVFSIMVLGAIVASVAAILVIIFVLKPQ